MGAGSKTAHASYSVVPAKSATVLVAVPETDEPFWANGAAPDDTDGAWAAAGFGPEEAQAWHHAGFGPGGAAAFCASGIELPPLAAAWVGAGFGPEEAQAWHHAGFEPAGAVAWAGIGFDAEEAAEALAQGKSPAAYLADQVEPPADGDAPAEVVAPAYAGAVSDDDWAQAVTPVPAQAPVGDPRGVPLLVGGDDLVGSSATLMCYATPDGPRDVLFCTVSEHAERKLLDALAPASDKLVPVEVTEEKDERLEIDTAQSIYEELVTAAKSINHHLKAGDGIPQHTRDRVDKLQAQIGALAGSDDPQLAAMAAHYGSALDAMAQRLAPGYDLAYDAGGKLPTVTAYTVPRTVTQVEYVPDTSTPSGQELLAMQARRASRISPTIDDGVVRWDGKKRSKAKGTEYVVPLDGGYCAIYHPYHYAGQDPSADDFSLRGQLELHAPAGGGHARDLVDRLGQLNLVNRPMTAAEAEWAYLRANIDAQGLASHPTVAAAVTESARIDDVVAQELMWRHAADAAGLDDRGLERLAQRLALEAEASALPRRNKVVRDAYAKAVGIGPGEALAADPAYRPRPRQVGGWVVTDRHDVMRREDELRAAFGSRRLYAKIDKGDVAAIFANGGVLAAGERRAIMGIHGYGMSPAADKVSGGALSAFLRVGKPSGGARIEWDDPVALLRRTDWYAYDGDHFGSLNPASGHSTHGRTTDPFAVAGFSSSGNEIMFRHGIDLLGDEAPSRVCCTSQAQRNEVISLLKQRGVTTLGGRPVEEVVVA
ncbi:MAG TPA: hypothetical protein VKV25_01945 [Acidimicrobiales bacterium]|nr:hypothetical protein [Acidimicrobiales bacterium]